jgi:hypothetical protein
MLAKEEEAVAAEVATIVALLVAVLEAVELSVIGDSGSNLIP